MVTLIRLFRGSVRLGKRAGKSSIKRGRASLQARRERQREQRFQRARTVKAIRESNLSQATQRREIDKLHRSRFAKFKARFKKEEPTKRARFGTEAENQ